MLPTHWRDRTVLITSSYCYYTALLVEVGNGSHVKCLIKACRLLLLLLLLTIHDILKANGTSVEKLLQVLWCISCRLLACSRYNRKGAALASSVDTPRWKPLLSSFTWVGMMIYRCRFLNSAPVWNDTFLCGWLVICSIISMLRLMLRLNISIISTADLDACRGAWSYLLIVAYRRWFLCWSHFLGSETVMIALGMANLMSLFIFSLLLLLL